MAKLKGINLVTSMLFKFGKDTEQFVKDETEATGREIELDAKKLAPVDLGKLRQEIIYNKTNNGFGAKIFANAPYSAYQEFGTGGLVNVPPELKEFAQAFKGKGIKQINLRPQPFLYPALTLNRQKYIEILNKKLQILTSNANKSR